MQQPPAQTHTLDTLRAALVTHKPQLETIIDTVFSKFTEPATPSEEIAEQLKTMLHREITPGEAEGARTFTWRNPSNQPIVLTIPMQDDQAQEEIADVAEAAEAAEATEAPAATETEPAAEAEAEADASDEDDAAPEPVRERVNLLDELDALLDDTNLHLIIQRTGKKDTGNILSVTVVPQATSDKVDPALLTPINLKGTARELEAGLLQAIRITTDGNRSIEEALAELEEAKKEAAAAKKAEASKAKKTASKAAPKAAAKKDEKPAEPAAPSLFDTQATKSDKADEDSNK